MIWCHGHARRHLAAVSLIACLLPGAAKAQSGGGGATEPRRLAVTVYNQDLALVRDVRSREVKSGRSEISFADVAAQVDPTSVHLRSSAGTDALRVLEQNYRYDLASSDAILTRYLDQPLEVVDKQGEVVRGALLSHDPASLVLRGADGGEEVTILTRSELTRMEFPRLPQGLITKPTLFWEVESSRGGRQDLEIEYLTGGMSWHAEYVAAVSPGSKQLSLSSWVSIDNHSGASYPDAKLKLVAGEVHRVEEMAPPMVMKSRAMAEDAGAQFAEKAFFEYHLYTLERPATVLDREVKQITLFPPSNVRSTQGYEYDGARNEGDVGVVLKFRNGEKDGLGIPLPAGKVRVYQEDEDGSLEFVGEDRIEHTPRDEEVRLRVGNAFDIAAERAVVDTRRVSDRVHEEAVEVKLRNHKKEAVTVTVVEHRYGDWEVIEKSHAFRKKDAYTLEFDVPVPVDQESVLRYRVRTRF